MLVKMGAVLDMPDELVAREAGIAISVVKELKQTYVEDIKRLKMGRRVAQTLFSDLATVRMSRVFHKLLDDILENIDEIPISKKIDFMQFLAKYLADQDAVAKAGKPKEKDDGTPASEEQIKARALRLLEGGKK